MPYDPNLQFQLNNNRLMHQRQAEYAAYRRRRRGSRGGGFILLLLLAAAGAYVYLAQPETWHSLVAHIEALVNGVQHHRRP